MKVIKIIIGIPILLIALFIIIALFSLGNKVNHDKKTSDRVAQLWNQVYVGESMAEVKQLLGEPDDVSTQDSTDFQGGVIHGQMWMYGTLSGTTTYSIDFMNGVVDSKDTL